MKDNVSMVLTMILLVVLVVIFPLYNHFERQDDMSYNVVLKATNNFANEVINSGYIDQATYDKYIDNLSATGNMYDVELEVHKKVYVETTLGSKVYEEQYEIDYNKDIFSSTAAAINEGDNGGEKDKVKNGSYLLSTGDKFYIKVKNSSTTMAGAVFNMIIPTAQTDRIVVNYGGVVKNNAWKKVETDINTKKIPGKIDTSLIPTTPVITSNPDVVTNNSIDPIGGVRTITFKATSSPTGAGRSIAKYVYTIKNTSQPEYTVESTDGNLTATFNEGISYIKVYAVDNVTLKSETTGVSFTVMNNFSQKSISSVGESTMDSIIISGATVSEYSFEVQISSGHGGNDYWKIQGLTTSGTWEQIAYQNVSNGVNTGNVKLSDPSKYTQLKFTYKVDEGHYGCLAVGSFIKYSVKYKFK